MNAFRREGVPVITVSDNGYGIVPEAMDKVFVPFLQLNKVVRESV